MMRSINNKLLVCCFMTFLHFLGSSGYDFHINCLYYSQGRRLNVMKRFSVTFYVPFNWDSSEYRYLDTLTLTFPNNWSMVLQPPTTNRTNSNFVQLEYLPTEFVNVGWNRLFFVHDLNTLHLNVTDSKNRWWYTTSGKMEPKKRWVGFYGMFSLVDCERKHMYSYCGEGNLQLPLAFNGKIFTLVLYGKEDFGARITTSRNVYSICSSPKNSSVLYVKEDCGKDSRTLPGNRRYMPLNISISHYYKKDYLTRDDMTFTDIIVHRIDNEYHVAILMLFSNVLYSDVAALNNLSLIVQKDNCGQIGAVAAMAMGLLLTFATVGMLIAIIVACKRGRIIRNLETEKRNSLNIAAVRHLENVPEIPQNVLDQYEAGYDVQPEFYSILGPRTSVKRVTAERETFCNIQTENDYVNDDVYPEERIANKEPEPEGSPTRIRRLLGNVFK